MPKFGVARKYAKDLPKYIEELSRNKVDSYEMGFAYGIPEDISKDILTRAHQINIQLSGHLPFWINLGNSQFEKNRKYLLSGLNIAQKLDSTVVFHLGFYGGKKFRNLKNQIVSQIQKVLEISNIDNGKLGIETTGKREAIGTIDEIIFLLNEIDDERVVPILDWSHIFARNDGQYPYKIQDFEEILLKFENELGYKPNYFHGGGVIFKNGNEVKHTTSQKCQPPLPYLFQAFHNLKYTDYTLIVESPDSINDIVWLRKVWNCPEKYFKVIPRKKTLITIMDFIKE